MPGGCMVQHNRQPLNNMHAEDLMRLRESDKMKDSYIQEKKQTVLVKELQQLIKRITIDSSQESNNRLEDIINYIKSR